MHQRMIFSVLTLDRHGGEKGEAGQDEHHQDGGQCEDEEGQQEGREDERR